MTALRGASSTSARMDRGHFWEMALVKITTQGSGSERHSTEVVNESHKKKKKKVECTQLVELKSRRED